MRRLQLDPLYPITDSNNQNGLSHTELVEHFLGAGVRFLQIREKTLSDSLFYTQLVQIRSLCKSAGAQFLVNDRVDLALAAGGSGVHLGQEDLPVGKARTLLGTDAIIGLSTHNRRQFLEAQSLDIDYVAIGPVFRTSTKEIGNPTLGREGVRDLVKLSRHPVVAIGGISLREAPLLWKAGVDSVAVISDIVDCATPRERILQYVELTRGPNL